ncbi:Rv0361 family membrane protein [Mycolicibacterium arenosum]|uniref:DUF8174 domain-containing protein n=1 Tax=Mycolicibacterium arenosum TaxID=2952157 RepID=A0ABT1MB88_9MYCO|nr:hypothetical protein [Mycolicibacterium sp. CAU 1645]MCP9276428.1 hypothetical protein [Mycolicibacterium sp. CAU 1645]
MAGPLPYPESPYPGTSPQQPLSTFGGPQVPSPYPGTLPPPVEYPKAPRRRRVVLIALGVLVAVMVAAVAATIVFAERGPEPTASTALTPDSAKAAIQEYLDALTQGKDEIIAEHASCGLFDAVKDKQADMALANLASETFRRQFSSAEVTTIDKIVELSPSQAQVLFSMDAKSAGRSGTATERQAVAQILVQGDRQLVCSYLPRNAGPF